jgi:hypothetical protein
MKKITYICSLLVFLAQALQAQVALPLAKPDKTYSPSQFTQGQCRFVGFRNPPSADLAWLPSLFKVSDNESENEPLLKKIKAEKNRVKQEAAYRQGTAAKTTATIPVVGTNFAGINNGGTNTPLDNTVAISNAGKIVAFINSKVSYYNTSGTATYTNDLWAMIGDASLVNNMCDPKVIYDYAADRFIFFAQVCDGISANSVVVLGFSKTNDPASGWWIYELTGNPLGDGSLFDYPKIGISNDELFVTGNLFFEGAGFNQSVVYQVAKAPCYAGGTISAQYWNAISGAFTILPVSLGQSGSTYGPGIYLVNTAGATSGSTNIKLHVITNNIASGSAALNSYNVTTPVYSTPGDAAQMGSSRLLDAGDCRALDGFYLNGIIHFVFNTDAGGSGWCGVYYNRLTVSSVTNTSSIFAATGTTDRCYPAVSSIGNSATDQSVMIAFNESNASMYPRTSAVICDNAMAWTSPIVVKAGTSYVHYSWSTTTSDRWGDYTGICRKYNSNPATAWMAGMYGSSSNTWLQWIAELKSGTGTIGSAVPEVVAAPGVMKVAPNPVYDGCNIIFTLSEREQITISILDMQGKVVKELYSTTAEAGENVFSFNKANLSSGTYFVHVNSKSTLIKNEKIVIEGK